MRKLAFVSCAFFLCFNVSVNNDANLSLSFYYCYDTILYNTYILTNTAFNCFRLSSLFVTQFFKCTPPTHTHVHIHMYTYSPFILISLCIMNWCICIPFLSSALFSFAHSSSHDGKKERNYLPTNFISLWLCLLMYRVSFILFPPSRKDDDMLRAQLSSTLPKE